MMVECHDNNNFVYKKYSKRIFKSLLNCIIWKLKCPTERMNYYLYNSTQLESRYIGKSVKCRFIYFHEL